MVQWKRPSGNLEVVKSFRQHNPVELLSHIRAASWKIGTSPPQYSAGLLCLLLKNSSIESANCLALMHMINIQAEVYLLVALFSLAARPDQIIVCNQI